MAVKEEISDSSEGKAVDLYKICDSLNWEVQKLIKDINSSIIDNNWNIIFTQVNQHILQFVLASFFHQICHNNLYFNSWKLCLYGLLYFL